MSIVMSGKTRDRMLTEAVQSERKRLRAAIARRVRDQAEAEEVYDELE